MSCAAAYPARKKNVSNAATPAITLGCEFYQASYFLAEDVLATPFPVENGAVVVPHTPGLGAVPDIGKIEKYSIQRSAR